jgi:hypothetical protein
MLTLLGAPTIQESDSLLFARPPWGCLELEVSGQGTVSRVVIHGEYCHAAAGTPTRSAPPPRAAGGEAGSLAAVLNGIWHVKSSDLGVFAPSYGLDKALGFVTWKLMLSGPDLVVLEYSPGAGNAWAVVGPDPERLPYQEMKVEDVSIDPGGEWIAFRIDRSVGPYEAYESVELNRISKGEIRGAYRIYDPYGGGPGTGGQFSGTIRLVPHEAAR